AADAGDRDGSAIEILTVLSLAQDAGGDRAAASATLAGALTRAEPEGYVRVFADELPALEPLVRATRVPGSGRDLAGVVLAGGGSPAERVDASSRGLVDPLSDRELDVLRLLRGELSGPEIARELHVSLNTLRTHTKNIYTKLRVNNRREAVRRAAELA